MMLTGLSTGLSTAAPRLGRAACLLGAVAFLSLCPALSGAQAASPVPVPPVSAPAPLLSAAAIPLPLPGKDVLGEGMLNVTLGKAEVIELPGAISDVMVADPKIANVQAIQSNRLYVVGSSIGDTNLIALDELGNVIKKMNIHVRVDTDAIEAMVSELFPQEKNVQVHMIGSHLALSGSVSTPSAAQKIVRLVAARMGEVQKKDAKDGDSIIENLLEVRGEQQVMLRVRILEVSRSVLKELGLETSANAPSTGGATLFGRAAPSELNGLMGSVAVGTQTGLNDTPFGIASMIFDSGINGIGSIQMLLNILEKNNLGNVLAEPNLTAVSGEEAGFLAGGEFPVPAGRDQNGSIIIDYKQFGVSLNFKPIVLSEDRISLQLNTEVSALNQAQGLTLSDVQIPGLDVRRASTTVELNSGGSLMMAGLLKSENTKGLAGIPGVKETPILGDLLSSKSFQRQETELVVIVTPYLVQPFADQKQAKAVGESVLGADLPSPPPTAAMTPPDKGKPEALVSAEDVVQDAQEKVVAAPLSPNSPLSKVFHANIKKIYGNRVEAAPSDQAFGYMLD